MCIYWRAQLSGELTASLLGLLSLLKSELILLSLSWRPCIVFQGLVLKIWSKYGGMTQEGEREASVTNLYGFKIKTDLSLAPEAVGYSPYMP